MFTQALASKDISIVIIISLIADYDYDDQAECV